MQEVSVFYCHKQSSYFEYMPKVTSHNVEQYKLPYLEIRSYMIVLLFYLDVKGILDEAGRKRENIRCLIRG